MRLITKTITFFLTISFFSASYAAISFERYGLLLCSKPGFSCINVKRGETWYKLFPNKKQRDIVMRLNRINVALQHRRWLIIPKDFKNIDYLKLAPFPEQMNTHDKKLILVNLAKFAYAAYNKEGELIKWGPATGGKSWCNDLGRTCQSAAGTFHIYRIQDADCASSKYPVENNGGAPMPYCMHYYKGFAIHGSTLMGFQNRSRGCIRIFNSDAKWLNKHFVKKGTEVIVRR